MKAVILDDQRLKTPFFGESLKNQVFRSMLPEIHKHTPEDWERAERMFQSIT